MAVYSWPTVLYIQSSADSDEESHHRRKKKVSSSNDALKSSDPTGAVTTEVVGTGSGGAAIEGGEEGRKETGEGESEAGRCRTTKWADKWDLKDQNT